MGDILPALRALVYETVLGVLLLVGPLALAMELFPAAPLPPEWGQAIGLAVALAGGGLWLWAAVVLVAFGRGTPLPLDPPRRLVVTGPYRWIRNPMHLGLAGVLIGEALLFRSIPLLAFAAAVTVALVLWEGPREERELAARFGERYDLYRGAVPGWLPRREDVRRAAERARARAGAILRSHRPAPGPGAGRGSDRPPRR